MGIEPRAFALLTVANYALITVLWAAILVLYLRYRRIARAADSLVAALAAVLALDAFKNVVESVYFGILWAGRYKIAFEGATEFFSAPGPLLVPKLLNLVVAVSVLVVIVGRFIPRELRERRERIDAQRALQRELEQSLDAVRAKEERWQLALEASQDATWDLDVRTGEVWVSPRYGELYGYAPGEAEQALREHGWIARLHPDEVPLAKVYASELFDGKRTQLSAEVRVKAKDGSYRRVLSRCVARYEDGKAVRIVGTDLDVTSLRKAEAALAAQKRTESLGLLAGGVAHDFNNLLAVMRGNANLAKSTLGEDPVLSRRALSDLEQAIAKATELSTRLLAYSGRGRFVKARLDLSAFSEEMARLLGSSAPPGVRIVVDAAAAVPPIEADAAQMQQVLLNVFTNAVDAIGDKGDKGGTVTIRTRVVDLARPLPGVVAGEAELAPARYVVLEIADDGPGMDQEVRRRLFEPFFSRKENGRGLGMAAILGIVRAHGGGIGLDTALGKGSTFTFYFPVTAALSLVVDQERTDSSRPRPPAATGPLRVLVVDDEPMLRRLLGRLLEQIRFAVDTAPDGPSALDAIDAKPGAYALVILDVTLPGMDGREVLARIRETLPTQPVLLMSGYAADPVALDEHTRFLAKPFSVDELKAAVATLIVTP